MTEFLSEGQGWVDMEDVNARVTAHEALGYLLPPQFRVEPDAITLNEQTTIETEVTDGTIN